MQTVFKDRRIVGLSLLSLSVLLFGSFPARCGTTSIEDGTLGVDEVWERILDYSQGWGKLGFNRCAYQIEEQVLPLKIGNKEYGSGLGHHSPGEIRIDLGGEFSTFEAEIGVQTLGYNEGSVVFKVSVGGESRFESGVLRKGEPAIPISIDVSGAEDLRLMVEDAGDGIACDCANWVNPRLVRASNRSVARTQTVDVAPFGTISTWDPHRPSGARATRIQEYMKEDIRFATEIVPDASGNYWTPVTEEGLGCIGVEWAERRFIREVSLTFADPDCVPPARDAKVQVWSGESAWQGGWEDCEGDIREEGDRWIFTILRSKNEAALRGTEKFRWLLKGLAAPVPFKELAARTASVPSAIDLLLEPDNPRPGQSVHVGAYNGFVLNPDGQIAKRGYDVDLAGPTVLKVQYAETRGAKTDRTTLLFRSVDTAFGVAIEDLLEKGCVYVPHAGLFLKRKDVDIGFKEYLDSVSDRKTILERVREAPDQTLEQAFEKVHNPIQDLGPMMLSLACDNRKFVAYRNGEIAFESYSDHRCEPVALPSRYRLIPRFGIGKDLSVERHLHGEWLPVPGTTIREGDVSYRQTTCVVPFETEPVPGSNGWLFGKAGCVSEFRITNEGNEPARYSFSLSLAAMAPDGESANQAFNKVVADGVLLSTTGSKILACIDLRGVSDADMRASSQGLAIEGELPAGGATLYTAYLPAWDLAPGDFERLIDNKDYTRDCEDYWNGVTEPAMKIETPDPLLNKIIRASQVHCLLAARNEEDGERIAAWISSDRYGPLESEAHSVIRGMDLMGYDEFARRSLDYFVHRYSPEGFLTTGYTIMGSGWHLWTLAEHFFRSQDGEWFEARAPEIARVCRWIADQRQKTKRLDGSGEKVPEYGLCPPGVSADWNRFAYRFYQEGHYCAGLAGAASALHAINHPEASALMEEARDYRKEALRAFHWTQGRSPVVELADGTWRPTYPGMLFSFGQIEDIIPGEDASRSWAYDVELGSHHLAALEILDPRSEEVGWMMDHMEDFWFLHSGWFDYPEEKNREDWYNLGGWGKVQPYYARNAEVYALRDDVKPFLRSYFNTIPTLLSLENLSFWEHFANSGGWNKTHETGYFLAQTRLMMVMERENDLWLAPMVTENWLRDGLGFSVENAPTEFGKVSFRVRSHLDDGFIEAIVEPPTRNPPDALVVRLRRPNEKPIREIEVQGADRAEIAPEGNAVRISPGTETIRLKAFY
jgi:hypothetical protein